MFDLFKSLYRTLSYKLWKLQKKYNKNKQGKQTKMAFQPTKKDIQRSQKCPVGIHVSTLVEVGEPYFNDKGTEVQQCDFETDSGYAVPYWFNNKMMSSVLDFVSAADGVKFTADMDIPEIDLKKYIGKKVSIDVSHGKDKNNKVQAQIDNFYSAGQVPY